MEKEKKQFEYEGELKVTDFAKKYEMASATVSAWVRHGYLEAVKRPYIHHTLGEKLIWFLKDKEPHKHKGFKNRDSHRSFPHVKDSIGLRKQILRGHLPMFMASSNPEIQKYTRSDLSSILNLPSKTFKTWEHWGLARTPFVGNKKIWPFSWYFSRVDIIDFLSGNWDEIKKRQQERAGSKAQLQADISQGNNQRISLDLAPGAEGNEGYFVYQHDKVFPHTYEGFMAWVKDFKVMREDKRSRKFIPVEFLENQKEFYSNAFKVKEDGDLQYQYVCTSRPRGEFKSFDTRMMFLFRFFNMFRETVLIAANSKDQSTFVQYDEAVKTIKHTERLRNVPGINIQRKSIELLEGKGDVFAQIVPIASKTGLLPNVTCVVFTEICDMRDEQFYSQLTGSIRGVPNAMVLIDSTVSPRGHIFHRLYKIHQKSKSSIVYFQHYSDKYFNPGTTKSFLNHQESTLLITEYNKYFRNRWEDGSGSVFPSYSLMEMRYLCTNNSNEIKPSKELREKTEALAALDANEREKESDRDSWKIKLKSATTDLVSVEERYSIPATTEDVTQLSRELKCDFIFGVGLDRANTMSVHDDRTVMSLTGRAVISDEFSLYFLLDMMIGKKDAKLTDLQERINVWTERFGWLDKIAIEAYQGQDFHDWCEQSGFEVELVHPNYKTQLEIFSRMCLIMKDGTFKCPPVPYYTDDNGALYQGFSDVKMDLFKEELSSFTHDSEKSWFGSPDKRKKGGVKDDTVYSQGLSIYATQGRLMVGSAPRGVNDFTGSEMNQDVVGVY